MFNFLKKNRAKLQKREALASIFKQLTAEAEAGRPNCLEAALALHQLEESKETFTSIIYNLIASDVFTLNDSQERLQGSASIQGADGSFYVPLFTSKEKALSESSGGNPYNIINQIAALEVICAVSGGSGIVINPQHDLLHMTFPPGNMSQLQAMVERGFRYERGYYSIWRSEGYSICKLLMLDEGGVHLRIFSNIWESRPMEIDESTLTLGGMDEPGPRGLGHIPIQRQGFLKMGPRLVKAAPVEDSELEGYNIWKNESGAYFD